MANSFQTQMFRHIQVFFKNKPAKSILSPESFTVKNTRCIQSTATRYVTIIKANKWAPNLLLALFPLGCYRWNGPVKLAYTSYEGTNSYIVPPSTATPIIIQHGLLGSRKNWASLGKAIHSKTGKKVVHFYGNLYVVLYRDLLFWIRSLFLMQEITVTALIAAYLTMKSYPKI